MPFYALRHRLMAQR